MAGNKKGEAMPVTTVEDVKLTAALHIAVDDLQHTVDELQDKVQAFGLVADGMISALKAFSDLYLELTEKTSERRFLEKAILRAEREVARTKLPVWFWRHDKNREIKYQIHDRVKHLNENKYSLDDIWTLVKEFCDEFTPETVTQSQLERVIEYTIKQGG